MSKRPDIGKRQDKIIREMAAPPAEPIGAESTTTGVVTWWNDMKGYGAIATEKTAPWDVWCHFAHIEGTGFKTLAPGERVEVDYVRFDQESFRYVARAVRRLHGHLTLVWPSPEYLPGYVEALKHGWSPDNLRLQAAADEELERIAADPGGFLASLVDREGTGPPFTLPDGTTVPRLPGYRRWLWDGEFCGSISLRWQRGTEALPPYCLGHIGYAVVPWKQRRGYATRALHEMLSEARAQGLRYVEITTDPDNVASQRVIERNGGVLVEEFVTPPAVGGRRELRYRIDLVGA